MSKKSQSSVILSDMYNSLMSSKECQDEFTEMFFQYVLSKDLSDKKGKDFFSTRNIIANQTKFMECLELIRYPDVTNFPRIAVDKEEVHKVRQQNVMIDSVDIGIDTRLSFFIGDSISTEEITLNHINEEHVEAIYLTEMCRQSCMVCVNQFLGDNSDYYIIEKFKKFKTIVKRDKPVIIQTLPVVGNKSRGRGICVFTIFQDEKICMSGFYQMVYTKRRMK